MGLTKEGEIKMQGSATVEYLTKRLCELTGLSRCGVCRARTILEIIEELELGAVEPDGNEGEEKRDMPPQSEGAAPAAPKMKGKSPAKAGDKKVYELPGAAVAFVDYIRAHEINLSRAAADMGISKGHLHTCISGKRRMGTEVEEKLKGYLRARGALENHITPAAPGGGWSGEKKRAALLAVKELREKRGMGYAEIADGAKMEIGRVISMANGNKTEAREWEKLWAYLIKQKAPGVLSEN